MTPEQVVKVQDSFKHVARMGDVASDVFYTNLFIIDPGLKSLFKSDMSTQGHKLLQALGFVVDNLHVAERIVPVAQALGVRHAGYGVTKAHYATVGEALIRTLSQALGGLFDVATREAWVEAYGLLTRIMCEAAYAKEPGYPMFI
jgi:hemoglobin-like flavoprotein